MTKYVFIDTCEFVKFFEASKVDIKTLAKFADKISDTDFVFVTTKQVKQEYKKNRLRAIKTIIESTVNRNPKILPPALGSIDEKNKYESLISETEKLISEVSRKALAKAKNNRLGADQAIKKIFDSSTEIEITPEIIQKARNRFDRGLPPRKYGKSDSIGDAINWECLLSNAGFLDELYIVSGDGDFESQLFPLRPNELLSDDWASETLDSTYIYKSLSHFIKDKIDQEIDALDSDRFTAVHELAESPSFSFTHAYIKVAKSFTHFTESEIEKLISALENNTQINWISKDPDVSAFYTSIYYNNSDHFSESQKERLSEFYSLPE
ncbi:PIN domain-containing protein [Maricaulis virginensis]|uniref:DUF4935 domain-containing protein n=1 Tax=Maricaulis virginensis TaxID=144022 RepID=A0A9W6IKB5_9PROT|nr:PIN domain-containing protein [Maricaulis virginensis]GLK51157.1 hypothetical protein GCM10017621_06650 [Maricaulis virginensis]